MHTLPKNQIDALSRNYPFDARDQEVHGGSLPVSLFGYRALALLCSAAVAVQVMTNISAADFLTTAIALASP